MMTTLTPQPVLYSASLWQLAWRRLRADRFAMLALAILSAFLLLLVLSFSGLIAADWEDEVAISYAAPHFVGKQEALLTETEAQQTVVENPYDPLADDLRELRQQLQGQAQQVEDYGIADPLQKEMAEVYADLAKQAQDKQIIKQNSLLFGADKWGHDIIKKTIKGAETSILVGIFAALLATFLGTLFGAFAGYFGGKTDDFFNWFYAIFTSIPYLLLILAVAAVLQKKGVTTIILILAFTGWTGPFRLIRAEYIKHKSREYVWAADAIGASHWRKMFIHIFPNVSHVALVQVSILVVSFIKSEVILSFLGFGVPVGVVSWGSMLNEAQNELILGKWWQLAAATAAMALLVTAFSMFTDALRDALDPKLK